MRHLVERLMMVAFFLYTAAFTLAAWRFVAMLDTLLFPPLW